MCCTSLPTRFFRPFQLTGGKLVNTNVRHNTDWTLPYVKAEAFLPQVRAARQEDHCSCLLSHDRRGRSGWLR